MPPVDGLAMYVESWPLPFQPAPPAPVPDGALPAPPSPLTPPRALCAPLPAVPLIVVTASRPLRHTRLPQLTLPPPPPPAAIIGSVLLFSCHTNDPPPPPPVEGAPPQVLVTPCLPTTIPRVSPGVTVNVPLILAPLPPSTEPPCAPKAVTLIVLMHAGTTKFCAWATAANTFCPGTPPLSVIAVQLGFESAQPSL